MALLDGWDACGTAAYDHIGCRAVPTHIFQFLRIADRKVIETLALPPETDADGVYTPDGGRLVFGGHALIVLDAARQAILERFTRADERYRAIAIAPNGKRAFVSGDSTSVLVFTPQEANCRDTDPALVNFYPGDGTSQDAIDTTSLTPEGDVSFAPGIAGQAFRLTGKGSRLRGGGRDACFECGDLWTASLYVKFNSLDGEMTILDRPSAPPISHPGYRLVKSRLNRLELQVIRDRTEHARLMAQQPVRAGAWYYLAVTSDSGQISLFVNGSIVGRETVVEQPGQKTTWGPFYLGSKKEGKDSLDGLIDEVMFHARALTDEEIRKRYQLRLNGFCKP
jgi:hypothetical protein